MHSRHHLTNPAAALAFRDLRSIRDRLRIFEAAFAAIGIWIARFAFIIATAVSHEATS
jgi:hypothetical protein